MSDCSTEAMKPKELPKTCGNCFHCVPRHGTRFIKRDGVCLYCGEAVETQSTSPICPCGNHRMWRERTYAIEQRYQQLEQIACEMFQDIESAFVRGKFKPEAYADYRDRLEAAGIETYGFKTEGEDD